MKDTQFEKRGVTKKSENISDWYTDVIVKSQMADYSPVRGCIVYRPLSYSIWESIQQDMNVRFKEMDIENSYFPLFIPEEFLSREKEHVKGFAPELAIVTIGGGEELKERLVVRPTSETIMYAMYSKWIQSHRDLPMKLNQWNTVVRWEKRTFFFLRGMEILWQEAHTAHATHEESWQQVLDALDAYAKVYEDVLALPVVRGRKSDAEKFAGADVTTTIEIMMPDGKALQSGTSHDLGQHFSKAFNVAFQSENGQLENVWQTSFGLSMRALGALVMVHGDDQGLVLPPKVAPVQVVIIPIGDDDNVLELAQMKKAEFIKAGIRVKVDTRSGYSLGYKRNDWELKGTPVRMEIGKKEVSTGKMTAKLRYNGEVQELDISADGDFIKDMLEHIQAEMFTKAKDLLSSLTSVVSSYDEFKKVMEEKRGFIHAFWCEDPACEKKIKEETKATTRCLPFDENHQVKEENGSCIACGKPTTHRWVFAQAY